MSESRLMCCGRYRHVLVALIALAACFAPRVVKRRPLPPRRSRPKPGPSSTAKITSEDVDKAYRRMQDASQTLSDEGADSETEPPRRPHCPGDSARESTHAEARGFPRRPRQRVRQGEEEHCRRRLSAGVDATQADAGGHAGRTPARTARTEGHRPGSRVEDLRHRSGGHRLLQRQSRAVQRGGGVVSPRADRRDAGRATHRSPTERRRCRDAAGGGGEGPDADGAPQRRAHRSRILPPAIQRIPSRRRAAAIWAWCRCPGSSRRHRHCARR